MDVMMSNYIRKLLKKLKYLAKGLFTPISNKMNGIDIKMQLTPLTEYNVVHLHPSTRQSLSHDNSSWCRRSIASIGSLHADGCVTF